MPNIVLILADDLGYGDSGFNGHPILRTPELDAMARSGLAFTRFYSAAPVCSPTRGSCLTGRHPYRYGVYFANTGFMKPQETTLAEILKANGYTTGHFGKWHLGVLTNTIVEANRGGPRGAKVYSPPWDNGFDVCFSTESKTPTWDPMLKPAANVRKTWWDPVADKSMALPYNTHYWEANGAQSAMAKDNLDGDDSRVIMDRAIPFIQNAAKDETPFLAVIWFHAPHLPVVGGEKYTAPYADEENYVQHYYGCIAALDEQVGRLRAELRELGIAENTLITFCSDNGPEGNNSAPGSAGGLRGRKRSLYEGGVRVPAIIEWPAKIKAGRTTDFPAVTSDYFPTVLNILGIDPPDDRPIDGVSLTGVFDGTATKRNSPIGFQSGNQVSWVDDQYKLIRTGGKNNAADASKYELYDLLSDRGEKNNIAQDQPDVVAKMLEELNAWRDSCKRSDAGEDY